MQLFTVGKVPMYCEGITHRLERRKDRDVKVVDLSLKVQPFSAQLAAALDAEYGFVKRTLFKVTNGDPVVDLRSVEFKLPAERQQLHCYAAPDTDVASIMFDQVKVTKIRARSAKDGTGWTLLVHVSFGPCDKAELAYVNDFYTGQRFVTWEQAEPSLDFDDEEAEEDDSVGRQAPMWDDGDEARPSAVAHDVEAARPTSRRGSGKGRRRNDPETESRKQRSEGAKRSLNAK